jgi:ribonuclease P protein component
VGVIVPKYGHNSVERNLVKRRLRTVVRCELLPKLEVGGAGGDVVVRALPSAYGASFAALQLEIGTLVAKLTAASSATRPTP